MDNKEINKKMEIIKNNCYLLNIVIFLLIHLF